MLATQNASANQRMLACVSARRVYLGPQSSQSVPNRQFRFPPIPESSQKPFRRSRQVFRQMGLSPRVRQRCAWGAGGGGDQKSAMLSQNGGTMMLA